MGIVYKSLFLSDVKANRYELSQ
ncbi:MAG: hypothetical protein SCARUB_02859 [Candidatus Scalindua rubra]|uniref:Uncharacterized protein n=1 Tax=Candidatus Scalindua rubra TaxID=1872076 RepID=A0A1E3XAK3_9BACT|nr:MAG: hypothetical protein SCARUB_02859 [Candidatus Scalindua rubra]